MHEFVLLFVFVSLTAATDSCLTTSQRSSKALANVHFINLNERTDRREQFYAEMANLGLTPENVNRFPAYWVDPGSIGCTRSHIHVLENALLTQNETVMVLEDDFEFQMSAEQVYDLFDTFFSSFGDEDWDVLMLAAPIREKEGLPGSVPTSVGGIVKIHRATTTTGYLVRSGYIPTLLANFKTSLFHLERLSNPNDPHHQLWVEETYALDRYWMRLMEKDKWFLTRPGMGKQRAGFSDIEGVNVPNNHFV